jgi:hypothetical protein
MLPESIRESAVPTGIFLPVSPRREEKLERLRAAIHLYDPQSLDLAAALVHCALTSARQTAPSRSRLRS